MKDAWWKGVEKAHSISIQQVGFFKFYSYKINDNVTGEDSASLGREYFLIFPKYFQDTTIR